LLRCTTGPLGLRAPVNFDAWHEWCQSIEPLHPGQGPEDVLDAARIVSLGNMQGHAEDFGWPEGAKAYNHPSFLGANIQITFPRSKYNPFLILDDRCVAANATIHRSHRGYSHKLVVVR